MALSNEQAKQYLKRLVLSRLRILLNNGFYGLLLMHMIIGLDEECDTAYTDGSRIKFSPKFMDDLSDSEIDFVMMHEILHAALRHCSRGLEYNQYLFNIACDIVVNSNILKSNDMKLETITLKKYGESMHLTLKKVEGYNYTAEEVYEMLKKDKSFSSLINSDGGGNCNSTDGSKNNKKRGNGTGLQDDHNHWAKESNNEEDGVWIKRVMDAQEAVERQQSVYGCGSVPDAIKRLIDEYKNPQIDWRTILSDFVQEEVCDYSFNPPDRRYDETGFYLPDYNDTEIVVADILFMIDTSGSMTDNMIVHAFSEVKGAIEQFNGKLQGWLGFFDSEVVEPIKFQDIEEFKKINAYGGGGTNFYSVFNYVNEKMADNPPKSIIMLTDGYAPFPQESTANGIPVLWLLNNNAVNPPWGKIARISIK